MNDRVALVTGAGSGIGRASSIAFAKAGARVIAADLDRHGGAETARLGPGGAIAFVEADLTREGEAEALIGECVARFGALDFLHNNAGVTGEPALLHELAEAEWDRVFAINARAAWQCMKHAIARMREHGGGAIVNTASVAGGHGFRRLAAYCASKAALGALTRVAAAENAAHGIRVNAVEPGMISTPMTGSPATGGPEPTGRMGDAAEVAQAVVWLCSDAASYVNGASLVIDGGWTAMGPPRQARPA
jgi:NAD(P)-dependent dehydrogenase (short-subunit alcohol dehydrogenase family)